MAVVTYPIHTQAFGVHFGLQWLHAVDSYTYLVHILQRINAHPAKRAIEFTPLIWKSPFADTPLRSDLAPHLGPLSR